MLIDNAGLVTPKRTVTVDGIETVFAVNHLAYLQLERGWRPVKAYALAKLGNVMFTYELARRLAGTGVTANCLHPGVIATKLLLQYLPLPAISQPLTRAFAGTPEQGAETPLYLAASPEVEGVTGTYFIRCKPKRSTDFSYDEAAARRLWDESDRLTRL